MADAVLLVTPESIQLGGDVVRVKAIAHHFYHFNPHQKTFSETPGIGTHASRIILKERTPIRMEMFHHRAKGHQMTRSKPNQQK